MKRIIVLMLMTFSAFAQSQTKDSNQGGDVVFTPFSPKAAKNTYGFKAKLLPYTIGNSFGTYSSLGTEIGFLKNQSVTIEGFYNYEQSSNDEVIDRQGNEFDSGNRAHMNEIALQLGYRYYYGIQKLRDHRVAIYNGLFFRAEQTKLNFDKNYEDIPYINRTMNVRAFGLLTGVVQTFRGNDHFGMDYNVSLGKSFTKTRTYNIAEDTTTFSTKNKHDSFYFNLGVSINYWF